MNRRLAGVVAVTAVAAAALPVVALTTPAAAAGVTYYRPADGVLHLTGHGYGHGHGLSQWGAYGGAISGQSYRQILAWYYGNPALGTAAGTLKVQLTALGADAEVLPATGLTATDAASPAHTLTLPAKTAAGVAYDRWRAVAVSAGYQVQGHTSTGWAAVAPTGGTAASWAGPIRFADTARLVTVVRPDGSHPQYRDTIQFDRTSASAGITVNVVTLEHYLAGVVPSEMPCSWTPTVSGTKRLDALEAQAVAARSYAWWRRANPRSSLVDLDDNTNDQAYGGYSAEKTATSECPWTTTSGTTSASAAAVTATAGQILVSSTGAALLAQYSASNGGFETSGGTSYLPSRPDAWDGVPTDSWSSHTWTATVTAAQIQADYPSIGTFSSLTVTSRENLSGTDQNGRPVGEQWGGRITGLTLTGSAGSVTTTGASFAGALGLMGPWFTVGVNRPGAPRGVAASATDGQATVTWAAPSTDGGGGIRGYTITATPAVPALTVSGSARSATVSGLANGTTYVFHVAATNTAGTGSAASAPAVTPTQRSVFHPLAARQLLDTRASGGALAAGATRTVTFAGVAGVPASGVTAVALDVASLDSTAAGSLRVYRHGSSAPTDPQLSWSAGQRVNTLVWVETGGGAVDVTTTAATQLLVDVEGYYAAAGGAGDVLTAAPTASRLFDSGTAPMPAGATQTIPVVGHGGVPTGATAVVVQLTAVKPAQRDYIRAWTGGAARPAPITLFAPAGRWTDATAVIPLTSAGTIALSPTYAAHILVTVQGWFTTSASPAAGVTTLLAPPRRVTLSVPAHGTVTAALGAPAATAAAMLTVGADGATGTPLRVWSPAATAPSVGTLHLQGRPTTTALVVSLGSGQNVNVANGGATPLTVLVDVAGWTAG